jgi:hypothetical protein
VQFAASAHRAVALDCHHFNGSAAGLLQEGKVGIPQFIAATWLALLCALAPAYAEKRVALVIGNGAYRHTDRLAKSGQRRARDARRADEAQLRRELRREPRSR